ncbi:MAG: GNAT family N-acetyltransferase [Bacteroidia bacterium]
MNAEHLNLVPIELNIDKSKPEYQNENCILLFKMWDEYYPKIGYHFPWVGYLVKVEDIIVGACGFTGPPTNDMIEISYWTFKEFEGRGISTRSCQAMIKIVQQTNPSLKIFAKTMPEENASTSILKKNGFIFAGETTDHEIGLAWKWTL